MGVDTVVVRAPDQQQVAARGRKLLVGDNPDPSPATLLLALARPRRPRRRRGDGVAAGVLLLLPGPPQHRGQEVRDHRRDAHAAGAQLHARRHVQREAHAPPAPGHGHGVRGQGREALQACPQLAQGRRRPRHVGV